MLTLARLFRLLQVISLSVMLFTSPAWAQSHRDTDDDTAALSQDVEDESDDDGRSFEQEIADIERHYADLVPDSAKSTASKDVTNDDDDGEDDSEDEEEE